MDATLVDPLDQGLWRLAPVGLTELERVAALRTRVDRKYVLAPPVVLELVDALPATVTVLEIGARRTFGYRSVYFDTGDRRSYLMAARRRPMQYKVRVRTYDETATTVLEVKTKSRRGETVKRRMPYAGDPAAPLTPDGAAFVDDVLASPGLAAALRPALTTWYLRSTVVDTDTGWRATLDRSVTMTDAAGPATGLGNLAVVETKSRKGATPVDRWLWTRHHRPRPISKFAVGTAALHPELPHHKWNRVMARHVVGPDPV